MKVLVFLTVLTVLTLSTFSTPLFSESSKPDIYIHQENTYYDYSPYSSLYYNQQMSMLFDISAGSAAISSIDFSNNSEGKFSIGFGLGGSGTDEGDYGYSSAFAFAFRFGLTDDDALVSKGWVGANGTASVGFGWSHDF